MDYSASQLEMWELLYGHDLEYANWKTLMDNLGKEDAERLLFQCLEHYVDHRHDGDRVRSIEDDPKTVLLRRLYPRVSYLKHLVDNQYPPSHAGAAIVSLRLEAAMGLYKYGRTMKDFEEETAILANLSEDEARRELQESHRRKNFEMAYTLAYIYTLKDKDIIVAKINEVLHNSKVMASTTSMAGMAQPALDASLVPKFREHGVVSSVLDLHFGRDIDEVLQAKCEPLYNSIHKCHKCCDH